MKYVLITGATAGIGKVTALDLATRGYRVFAAGRKKAALAELGKAHANITPIELDVTSPDQIGAAHRAILEQTGGYGIDVLVNNAGYATVGPLAELSDSDLRAQFETNVFGLMGVTRTFLNEMFERRSGRVINVSSVSGRVPAPLLGAYHASKYALEAMSDALRMELRPFGIRVVVVEPGTIRTEFASRTIDEAQRARVVRSRYEPIYGLVGDIEKTFDRVAVGPETVVRAIRRAIEKKSPPARIVAPLRFMAVIYAVRLLPTWLVDCVMRSTMGLTTERLLGRG
jgi:short-subunit dehydrogenase